MEHIKNLKNFVLFELKSFLGRVFFGRKPALNGINNYLNLGCGPNIAKDYVNADFFNNFQIRKKDRRKLQWQLDLRFPLECDDNVFDGVFTEHTLEHLSPLEVRNLLKELHRVMKKNAVIRMTVPDLEKYVDFYIGRYDNIDVSGFKNMYETGCEAIRNTTQNYGHKSVWDFAELKLYLEGAGFEKIQKMSFGESADANLLLDSRERAWETLYVEGEKAG